jgi:hypothetical protein
MALRLWLASAGNVVLLREWDCDIMSIGSQGALAEDIIENLRNRKPRTASTDTFSIVICSGFLCRGVL